MLIRSKLLLSGALSIGALVAMFGLQQYSLSNQADLARIGQNVIELEKGVLDIRKDEKDFFDRLDWKYVSSHGEKLSELDALLNDMRQAFPEHGIATASLDSFGLSVSVYNTIFFEVVGLQTRDRTHSQGADSAAQVTTAGDLLQQVNADVTDIMDVSTQIATVIERQSQVTSEVNQDVVVIRDIAEQSLHTASENASASTEVKSRAEFLQEAVSKFRI